MISNKWLSDIGKLNNLIGYITFKRENIFVPGKVSQSWNSLCEGNMPSSK